MFQNKGAKLYTLLGAKLFCKQPTQDNRMEWGVGLLDLYIAAMRQRQMQRGATCK